MTDGNEDCDRSLSAARKARMKSRLASPIVAWLVALTFAPTSAAAGTYGPCDTGGLDNTNHIAAWVLRNNFADYNAVRGTVLAKPVSTCTPPISRGKSGTYVLPANIATGSVLAQLGYGRYQQGSPVTFLYTPNDNTTPLGVLAVLSLNFPVVWGHTYTFEITQTNFNGPTWNYKVTDNTTGASDSVWQDRHIAGHANEVHYMFESYNKWDQFGSSVNNKTWMTKMEYRSQNNTVWTTLTNDDNSDVVWGGAPTFDTRYSFNHASAASSSGNGFVSQFGAWTDSH
jgi:hypothetical protein